VIPAENIAAREPAEIELPFNPGRFARLGLDDLYNLAREWMTFETAFGMCLNAALLQGKKELAARLAAHMGQAKLAPAFYLYRTAGLTHEAMKLVEGPIPATLRPGAFVPGIVCDAIAAAKTTRPDLHKELLRKIIAAAPDLTWSPATHAFLYREAGAVLDEAKAQALGLRARPVATGPEPCLAGITRVRNEGGLVSACVGNMLKFCDFVLLFDHNSDDGAPEEAQSRFGASRVEILRQPDMGLFDEKRVNDHLFARAREKKATHMVLIEADEQASPDLADPALVRDYARSLAPGEVLTVPYPQAWEGGFVDYRRFENLNECVRFLPPFRDFLYCDDGKSLHRKMMLHNPWLPEARPARRHFIDDPALCNIHFEKANSLNGMLKNDLYILRELYHFSTPLPTVLARYLAPHLIHNATRAAPPPPDPLANPPCEDYKTLCEWRRHDARELFPRLPPPARFLLNFAGY